MRYDMDGWGGICRTHLETVMSTDETLLNDEVNVGDVLDERYELLELIGRGGCGLVFLAKDLNLDREVAVKVLAGEGVAQKETLEKFEQEGQILRRLHAQNTVFFYDNGETPQHLPYIVMEFVRGTPLNVVLEKEGRLPVKRAVSILSQVLTSLAEAHEYGFIHRDLKPGRGDRRQQRQHRGRGGNADVHAARTVQERAAHACGRPLLDGLHRVRDAERICTV